jgi:hypothetical protein
MQHGTSKMVDCDKLASEIPLTQFPEIVKRYIIDDMSLIEDLFETAVGRRSDFKPSRELINYLEHINTMGVSKGYQRLKKFVTSSAEATAAD